jgi:hypothetical protein
MAPIKHQLAIGGLAWIVASALVLPRAVALLGFAYAAFVTFGISFMPNPFRYDTRGAIHQIS